MASKKLPVASEFIQRAKSIAADLEELVEDIEIEAADRPREWTEFDVKRTTLDLKVAHRLATDVSEKLKQVGTWKTK